MSDASEDPIGLLPCPFCGGSATMNTCRGDRSIRNGKPFYWVQHQADDCPIPSSWDDRKHGMESDYFDTPLQAASSWNRRVPAE